MVHSHKAHELMGKAKAHLVVKHPFFASLICNMEIIEDVGARISPTLATDCLKKVWYNPEFIEGMDLQEVMWCLAHETGHAIFQHGYRRGHRHPAKWNIAGDFLINQLLEDEGIGKRVPGVCFDPELVKRGGGTTDGIYNLLPDPPEGSGPGCGDGQWDVLQDAGGTQAERDQAAAEMRVNIAQAAATAKMCSKEGKLSANLEQFIEGCLKPKVDWRDVLRNFVTQRAKVEYTYARPKRRWVSEDLYLPSLGGQSMGKILIAVDQSGSVGEEDVLAMKTEMLAIQEDVKPEQIHVFYFDSQVAKTEVYEKDEPLDTHRYTTGGTAFSPIFAKEAEMDIAPVCCVVLTDLYCSDFGPAPDYPVLWVTTGATAAPWGRVVEMNPKL